MPDVSVFNLGGQFLSTLSLRRATTAYRSDPSAILDFYPRSPCGERLSTVSDAIQRASISIHALLAESDCFLSVMSFAQTPFLSTLSLRRATDQNCANSSGPLFLSTLSLRRATCLMYLFSTWEANFYPRSPCGERPGAKFHDPGKILISIHALLAESDHTGALTTFPG